MHLLTPETFVVPESLPSILVANRQRRIRIECDELRQFAERALAQVLALPGADLPPDIGVVLVSDRRICELHRDFMGLNAPTDVITFQHGEIVLSVDTAERQAAEHGTSLVSEVKLYLLHGLLHLRGYDDRTPEMRREMAAVQTRLFAGLHRSGGREEMPQAEKCHKCGRAAGARGRVPNRVRGSAFGVPHPAGVAVPAVRPRQRD